MLFAAYHLKPVVARVIAGEVVIAETILCALVDPRNVAVEDAVGVSLILVGITLTLVTARNRFDEAITSLRYDAEHDAVTGLLSRRTFDVDIERLDAEQPVSLILVDIDDFKTVNDTFGHAVGDQTLRIVADALTANSRQGDRAYRLGGDELAVLMSGIVPAGALRRAEVIRRAVETAPTAFRGQARARCGHGQPRSRVAAVSCASEIRAPASRRRRDVPGEELRAQSRRRGGLKRSSWSW